MPEFTPQQLKAIRLRGENLLVSAAAGSGKTAVLVERIVSLLREGASLENMLVVTYTRAAAAEMRARVALRLGEEAATDHIRRQIAVLPRAQICTLHSFCIDLLKRHFLEADLPPAFSVDAGPGSFSLSRQAIREALDEALSKDEGALSRLGRTYQYEDMIREAAEFLLCQPDPQRWMQRALDGYAAMAQDFSSSSLAASLHLHRQEKLREAQSLLRTAQAIASEPGGPSHFIDTFAQDERVVLAALEGTEIPFGRRANSVKPDYPAQAAAVALRDRVKGMVGEALQIGNVGEEDLQRMQQMLPSLDAFLQVVWDYATRFARMRVAAGRLSFSDLEHRTLAALEKPEVAAALRRRYDAILVDEYQDANRVQEEILAKIARAGNRFMVGDVKQSIYRFRMADPTLFIEKQRSYGAGEGGVRIDLNRNFRSVPSVLNAVNHLFSRAMNGGASEIEYGEREALYPGRGGDDGPPVELMLIERPQQGEEDELAEWSAAEAEAQQVAQRIAQMIGQPLCDGGEPVRARDIAILMRSVRPSSAAFRSALEARGIEAAVDAGGALFSTLEVMSLMDLLRAIDNRHRDIPLLGAMRCFGGFSLGELTEIRLHAPGGDFSSAALSYAQAQGELAQKTAAFLDRLLIWRQQARSLPLTDFLTSLLRQTRYERLQSIGPRADLRVRNIRSLVAMAGRMPGASLGEFIDAAALMPGAGGDEATSQELPEDVDAVRILSVHKSKGLEFPVVFGCGLGRRINRSDAHKSPLLHGQLGIACRWMDQGVSRKADTPAQQAIACALDREGLAEELRILYVMMTRPREKLVLTCALPSLEGALARWAAAGEGIAGLTALIDVVGPAVLRHPDGAPLRERLAVAPEVQPHPARYSVHIVSEAVASQQILRSDSAGALLLAQAEAAGQDVPAQLAARLRYRPPVQPVGEPQKTSVTAVSRKRTGVAHPPALPVFLEGREKSPAAQRGLAMHAVLRALDFDGLRGLSGDALRQSIAGQLDAMTARRLLTGEQARQIDIAAIARFLGGEIGRAALSSPRILREQPFNLRVDDGDAVRLMQGIIDLCYLNERGEWVLIDYKTDRYELSPDAVAQRHGDQLDSYARALEALTGRPVAQKLVMLFHTGQIVQL